MLQCLKGCAHWVLKDGLVNVLHGHELSMLVYVHWAGLLTTDTRSLKQLWQSQTCLQFALHFSVVVCSGDTSHRRHAWLGFLYATCAALTNFIVHQKGNPAMSQGEPCHVCCAEALARVPTVKLAQEVFQTVQQ